MQKKNQQKCRVFVSGEWRAEESKKYASEAHQLGKLLAETGEDR